MPISFLCISLKRYKSVMDYDLVYNEEEYFSRSLVVDLNQGNLLKVPKVYVTKTEKETKIKTIGLFRNKWAT